MLIDAEQYSRGWSLLACRARDLPAGSCPSDCLPMQAFCARTANDCLLGQARLGGVLVLGLEREDLLAKLGLLERYIHR